jgi:AAA domain
VGIAQPPFPSETEEDANDEDLMFASSNASQLNTIQQEAAGVHLPGGQPHASSPLLRVTRVTSESGLLTKRIALADDGTLRRTTVATLTGGTAEVVPVPGLRGLADLVATLTPSQALMFGVLRDGATTGRVVTQHRLRQLAQSQNGVPAGTYARDKEAFGWDHGKPGVLMLDVDPDSWPETVRDRLGDELSLEMVRAALIRAVPALVNASMLGFPSTSSMIFHATTGACLRGLAGMRLYVAVADADEIPSIGTRLAEHLVLQGYGYPFISRSGHVEVRTLLDLSVFQPYRLDFIGGAACEPPLEQRRGEPILWNPTASPILGETIPELLEDERAALDNIRRTLLDTAADEAARVRAEYRASRIAAGAGPQSVDRALENEELLPDFPITLTDGTAITVREVLADPGRFHDATCCDPIEPDYRDDTRIARIYTLGPQPVIHSFAHGTRVYRLVEDPATHQLHARQEFEANPDAVPPAPATTAPTSEDETTAVERLLVDVRDAANPIHRLIVAAKLRKRFGLTATEIERAVATLPGVATTDLNTGLALGELLRRPELLTSPAPAIPHLAWPGLKTLLSGREKSGKSTFALAGAAAASSGSPFLGEEAVPKVVLWVTEEPLGVVVRRAQAMKADPTRFIILTMEANPAEQLHHAVDQWRPQIVVIDTLYRYAGVEDENDAAVWLPVFARLDALTRAGVAILLLVHATKASRRGEYRGSSAIGGHVDAILAMSAPNAGSVRHFLAIGRIPLSDFDVRRQDNGTLFTLLGEPDRDAQTVRDVQTFLATKGAASRSRLRRELRIGQSKVDSALRKLVDDGIVMNDNGRFQLVSAAQEFAGQDSEIEVAP